MRQAWISNIPLGMAEGSLIMLLHDMQVPVPYKCVVRQGSSANHQFAIATFDTIEMARDLLSRYLFQKSFPL